MTIDFGVMAAWAGVILTVVGIIVTVCGAFVGIILRILGAGYTRDFSRIDAAQIAAVAQARVDVNRLDELLQREMRLISANTDNALNTLERRVQSEIASTKTNLDSNQRALDSIRGEAWTKSDQRSWSEDHHRVMDRFERRVDRLEDEEDCAPLPRSR